MFTIPFLKKQIIYLWGAGGVGCDAAQFLRSRGITASYFVDISPQKQGTFIEDLKVVSPDQIPDNALVLITTTQVHSLNIAKELQKREITFAMFRDLVYSSEEYSEIESFFTDEKSIKTLNALKAFYTSGNRYYLEQVYDQNQYFAFGEFQSLYRYEIFIDCGAFVGDSLEKFLTRSDGMFTEYHSFEPDKNNFTALEKRIERLNTEWNYSDRLFTYNKGVGKENGIHHFENYTSTGGRMTESGETTIEVIKLDDLNLKPTFIKADIEGAELDMLQGAAETIKKYKPKLAICVYHKHEDIITIPKYIKNLVPEYKLAIRQHQLFENETVLYAWCE
jgi:FkbM family methyltransferase